MFCIAKTGAPVTMLYRQGVRTAVFVSVDVHQIGRFLREKAHALDVASVQAMGC